MGRIFFVRAMRDSCPSFRFLLCAESHPAWIMQRFVSVVDSDDIGDKSGCGSEVGRFSGVIRKLVACT